MNPSVSEILGRLAAYGLTRMLLGSAINAAIITPVVLYYINSSLEFQNSRIDDAISSISEVRADISNMDSKLSSEIGISQDKLELFNDEIIEVRSEAYQELKSFLSDSRREGEEHRKAHENLSYVSRDIEIRLASLENVLPLSADELMKRITTRREFRPPASIED